MSTDLVERAGAGDHDAFSELVALEGDRCYAIAYRILRDTERAQDAVRVMYLQAWRELPRLRDPDRFGVWLYRLLVNACYEELRRHRRWSTRIRALPIDGPSIPDPTMTIDDRDALDRAFEHLTPERRAGRPTPGPDLLREGSPYRGRDRDRRSDLPHRLVLP